MDRSQIGVVVLVAASLTLFIVGWLPETCSLNAPPPPGTPNGTILGATCSRPGSPLIVAPLWLSAVVLLFAASLLYRRSETT